mmetsp:Transcript_1717/g.2368  ORF Transcript_1717/g.2368 Transcript_1717/m.2368 type:complete len:94 (+) Transcript_1717:3050-3331(+)
MAVTNPGKSRVSHSFNACSAWVRTFKSALAAPNNVAVKSMAFLYIIGVIIKKNDGYLFGGIYKYFLGAIVSLFIFRLVVFVFQSYTLYGNDSG